MTFEMWEVLFYTCLIMVFLYGLKRLNKMWED